MERVWFMRLEGLGFFWGGGNVLFYDLGIGYRGVKFVKI